MAEVGGTRKVTGNKIATPLTEPRPGMAPMKSPTTQPRTMSAKFNGVKATTKPESSELNTSMEMTSSVDRS